MGGVGGIRDYGQESFCSSTFPPSPFHPHALAAAPPIRRQVTKGQGRGVNKQHFGFAGEDAYFYCNGR
jgi:hypothetical protein